MPAYTQTSMATLQAALAGRLNDAGQTFTVAAENTIYLTDAMRLWQALTADAKQWWNVPSRTAGTWGDLLSIAGSPRLSTFTDTDIYQRMLYLLLENGGASASASPLVLSTAQFTTSDFTGAVQRARD